jgi:hypothetical protein
MVLILIMLILHHRHLVHHGQIRKPGDWRRRKILLFFDIQVVCSGEIMFVSIYRNLATLFSISFPLSKIRPIIRLPLVSMSGCQSFEFF